VICVAPPAISRLTEVNVTKPEVTWVKLNDLTNDTDFSFYVWATTTVGRGDVTVITERTLPVDCEYCSTVAANVLVYVCVYLSLSHTGKKILLTIPVCAS